MSDTLVEYIGNLLRQGYDEARIRQALAQNNYPQSMVDAAFNALSSGGQTGPRPTRGDDAGTANQGADNGQPRNYPTNYPANGADAAQAVGGSGASAALTSYLRTYLAQGYQAEQLRPYLLQQGYRAQDVDDAIAAATGQPVIRHEVHVSGSTFVKLALVILVAVVAVFGILHLTGDADNGSGPVTGSRLLDVDLTLSELTVEQGGAVTAIAEATNMGDAAKYDVEFSYRLLDGEGTLLWTTSNEKAIATSVEDTERIPIDADLPAGRYTVEVETSYGGEKTAKATETLTVTKAAGGAGSGGTTGGTTGGGTGGSQPPPIIIITPDEGEDASDLAAEEARRGNANKAEGLCMSIENQKKRDDCLRTITLTDREATHCDAITSNEERDTCYMPFVIGDGRYELCAKLTSQEKKGICENLQHISGLGGSQPTGTQPSRGPDINDFTTPG